MEGFLDIRQDWFARKYLPLIGRRFWSFKIALNLLNQMDGKNILEVGCIREKEDWKAGMSTLLFAEYASRFKAEFDSIDISEKNIEVSKEVTKDFKKSVVYHLGDSLKVLKEWFKPIDLLFLDSKDCDPENDEISRQAQEHQLKELELAYPNLTKNAIVLLDDNYFDNGGKTALAKDFLWAKKWVSLMDYEQSLWIRTG